MRRAIRRCSRRERAPESQPIQQAPDVVVLAVGPYHDATVSLDAQRLLARGALVLPAQRLGVPFPAYFTTLRGQLLRNRAACLLQAGYAHSQR